MSYIIIYTVVPSFEKSHGLYLEIDSQIESASKMWVHNGELSSGFDSLESSPWWFDIGKIDVPDPVILQEKDVVKILDLVTKLTINPIPENIMGMDGTNYTLEIHRGFNDVKYHWWSELPPEWKAFRPLVTQLDKLIAIKDKNL